ncbi:MAG: hypothetical protein OXU45_06005 [Candidatus Melainabacteria bacterium]|nr:hypothetical protein [Candidatus Melainabacteria bacterium]
MKPTAFHIIDTDGDRKPAAPHCNFSGDRFRTQRGSGSTRTLDLSGVDMADEASKITGDPLERALFRKDKAESMIDEALARLLEDTPLAKDEEIQQALQKPSACLNQLSDQRRDTLGSILTAFARGQFDLDKASMDLAKQHLPDLLALWKINATLYNEMQIQAIEKGIQKVVDQVVAAIDEMVLEPSKSVEDRLDRHLADRLKVPVFRPAGPARFAESRRVGLAALNQSPALDLDTGSIDDISSAIIAETRQTGRADLIEKLFQEITQATNLQSSKALASKTLELTHGLDPAEMITGLREFYLTGDSKDLKYSPMLTIVNARAVINHALNHNTMTELAEALSAMRSLAFVVSDRFHQ